MAQQTRALHAPRPASGAQHENVRAGLQRATHAAHVRINQHPLLSGLTKPGYPLDRYKALLAAYYHIYDAIERRIDAFLASAQLPFSYAERRKLPWLSADLGHFGTDAASPALSPLRPIRTLPATSIGALIGMLYAIEGATLGGQIISRHLQETLDLSASTGACFFNGYGDAVETQRHWREFADFANSIDGNPTEQRLAEASALSVFELIEEQLNDYRARLDS